VYCPRLFCLNSHAFWEGSYSAGIGETVLPIPPVTEAKPSNLLPRRTFARCFIPSAIFLSLLLFSFLFLLYINLPSTFVFYFVTRLMSVLSESSYTMIPFSSGQISPTCGLTPRVSFPYPSSTYRHLNLPPLPVGRSLPLYIVDPSLIVL
jgi:hypothetical protein